MHLRVGDLAQAGGFYRDGIGFDPTRERQGAAFLSSGRYHHHLGLNTWAGPRAQPPAASQPRLLDWQLLLPDARAVADTAASLAEAAEVVSPEEVGGSVATDPWGTSVRLSPLMQ